jgi:hypothetical protein
MSGAYIVEVDAPTLATAGPFTITLVQLSEVLLQLGNGDSLDGNPTALVVTLATAVESGASSVVDAEVRSDETRPREAFLSLAGEEPDGFIAVFGVDGSAARGTLAIGGFFDEHWCRRWRRRRRRWW